MRDLKNAVLVGIVIVAAVAVYRQFFVGSLDHRVATQGERIDTLSTDSLAHQKAIEEQGGALGEARKDIGAHALKLTDLEQRLAAGEALIRENRVRLEGVESREGVDRKQVEDLEKVVGDLRQEGDKIRKEHEDLLRQMSDLRAGEKLRWDELERRLRELERHAGTVEPEP